MRSNKAGVTEGNGLEKLRHRDFLGGQKKSAIGSEMCIMEHSLVEKEKLHAKYHVSPPQAKLSSEWASARLGVPLAQDQGICGGSGVSPLRPNKPIVE